jgi:hypothetical protein
MPVGIEYAVNGDGVSDFAIFGETLGFSDKNGTLALRGQDNFGDDPTSEGGDVVLQAGLATGANGVGGKIRLKTGTNLGGGGELIRTVDTVDTYTDTKTLATYFTDLMLSGDLPARKLLFSDPTATLDYSLSYEGTIAGAEGYDIELPGKPTRPGGDKFQIGDILSVRADDANNALLQWSNILDVQQAALPRVAIHFDITAPSTSFVIPAGVVPVKLPPAAEFGTLESGFDTDFSQNASGSVIYEGLETFAAKITATLSVQRTAGNDQTLLAFINIGTPPAVGTGLLAYGQQVEITATNELFIIHVEAVAEITPSDQVQVWIQRTDGGPAYNLNVQSYTLAVTPF